MADEIQPAQSTPSNLRRPVHVSSTGTNTRLLSLPDNVFQKLFECLSWGSGTAGFRSEDAFSLSATCRQLNDCYRFSFVVALRLWVGPRTPPDILFRALERLPRVRSIDLRQTRPLGEGDESDEGDSFEAYLCVLRKTASMHESRSLQSRALDIKEFYLGRLYRSGVGEVQGHGTEVEASTESMRIIVETFSNLEALSTGVWLDEGGDDAVTAISDNLSNSLRTLRLLFFERLSDLGGVRIGELHCLRKLEVRSCGEVTDTTFNALGALEELVELTLWDCAISGTAACSLVARLRNLTKLHFLSCKHVTSDIFRFLPRSLVTLEMFSCGEVTTDRDPHSMLAGVPNLTSLQVIKCPGVNDLSFLLPVALRLRVLYLSKTYDSDSNVAHWLRQMPNLERLDLTAGVAADETAQAVSVMTKIIEVHLDGTQITDDGVQVLASGAACQTLEVLTLSSCSNISAEDGALDALDRVVSANKKRKGTRFLT